MAASPALPASPIELDTPRLRLRLWRNADREPFAALNQDPRVMEHFPALIPRERSDASIDAFMTGFAERGWSNWAVERRDSGEFIGFTGLTIPARQFAFSPCIEVGWRLAHAHWGRGFASEAARAALEAGFERIGLAEIVSMTALTNLRSQAVMRRIGLVDAQFHFEHPGVPEGHPVRPHCLYRLTAAQWRDAVRR
ncbi:MAG TPA: GNAT family N-acetyltransferase [Ideonella sp.]|jgi:RimJ/RimL family protein N-acetyltransferase|nr:GNAT family N-acetyltransferase [Ideonella sp.]